MALKRISQIGETKDVSSKGKDNHYVHDRGGRGVRRHLLGHGIGTEFLGLNRNCPGGKGGKEGNKKAWIVLLKVWSIDQQQQPHLHTSELLDMHNLKSHPRCAKSSSAFSQGV